MKKVLLYAALAIGIAGPAHADPVSAIAAVFTSFGVGAAAAVSLAQMAVGFGAQLLAGVLGKAMAEKPKVNVQFDIELGDDTPLSFIAGDYVTAGKRRYLGSWGKNSRYITEVIEVSCLPQPGLAGLWVNDEAGVMLTGQTDTDGTPHNLGTPVTNLDDDGHRIWVRWVDGTQVTADKMLTDLFGSTDIYPYYGDGDGYPWTADMIGTGKSYAIVTTRYDSETLTSYPSYLWQPEPLPMYDPRKDGSTGGVGAHRWGNRSTYEPTRNAAVIAYNVARGVYYGDEWIFGGRNLPAWRLPRAEWVAAMTACDRAIALAGGGTEPAFRAGLEIKADMTAADVLEELGRAANMRFAEVGGMLKPIVGIPGAAVFAFTDGDILISEGQSFKPFDSLSNTFNALAATYPEPAEKWSTKDAPEYVDAAFTAADGGRYLPTSIAYPAAPYRRQVQRLMRAQMRDYRRFRTHQFYLPPDAYGLEPLVDVVSWTSARNGYVNKLFVVESVAKTPGMNVLVTLREVDPSDYDWSSDFELPTSVVTPVIVQPWVQPINGFGAIPIAIRDDAGNARRAGIRVVCNGDEVGVDRIRIQARVMGEAENVVDTLRPFADPYRWHLVNVLPMTRYQVRAQLVSDITPRSAWSEWLEVLTLDIRAGSLDLDFDLIRDEVLGDLSELEDMVSDTGGYIRSLRSAIELLAEGVAENEFGNFTARDTMTRRIGVEIDDARAEFTEQIAVAVGPDSALAVKIEEVKAVLGDAEAGAFDVMSGRVQDTEDGLVAQGDRILTAEAKVGRVAANGLIRMTSVAEPTGASSRVAIAAEATSGEVSHSASLFLEANTDGTNQVLIAANRFAVVTGTGLAANRQVPFVIDGGVVYMDTAFIRDATITGAKIGNLEVDTLNIKDGAVTQVRSSANWTGVATDNTSTWVDVHTLTWNSAKAGLHLQSIRFRKRASSGGATFIYVRLVVDGAAVPWPDGSTEFQITGNQSADSPIQEFTFIRSMSTGSHTMRIQMRTGGNHATVGGEITDLEWYK